MHWFSSRGQRVRRKASIYQHTAFVDQIGSAKGTGRGASSDHFHLTYAADGCVYHDQQQVGEWYAFIRMTGFDEAWVVKRSKLNDPARIEEIRWRNLLRFQRLIKEADVVDREARALGRVWQEESESFLVWREQCQSWVRVDPDDPDEDDVDAITLLGMIPRPEEHQMGARLDAARRKVVWARETSAMLDEVLATAFDLTSDYDQPAFSSPSQQRFEINGRVYYIISSAANRATWQRVWPLPSDVVTQL